MKEDIECVSGANDIEHAIGLLSIDDDVGRSGTQADNLQIFRGRYLETVSQYLIDEIIAGLNFDSVRPRISISRGNRSTE